MQEVEPFVASEQAGVLAGPVRRPVNVARDAAGSIHDDAAAQALGFRGGTVAANIHLEQFPPLLLARFGPGWWRTGGLSLHFLNATTDREPVQAFVGPVEEAGGVRRARAHMATPDGAPVCEGSAWIGGDDPGSALRQRLAQQRPPGELRILRHCAVGDAVQAVPSRIDPDAALRRLEGITEPLSLYADGVAAPAVVIDALRAVEEPLFRSTGDFVAMFGAIELQFIDGPIRLGHDYVAEGRVVALSESPKTEVAWYESLLRQPSGAPVARLLMMSRVLKASSPLWRTP